MKELKLIIKLPTLQLTIPEGKLSFQYLEQLIFEVTRIIGQELLTQVLQLLDKQLREERERGELTNCGTRGKYLLTLLGNITYQKHLYRDKEGHYRSLLEETLGISPNQRTSLGYQKMAGLFSFLAGSYRKAEEFLNQSCGDAVSFECIRRQVQREGRKIQKEEEATFRQILEEGRKETTLTTSPPVEEPLYLEVDGTMIHLQRQTEKRAELKLALFSKGKERRYPSGASKAKKVKESWVYAGIGSGEEFMAKVSLLAEEKFQLSDHKLLLVGGDGASWIKEGVRDYFPQAFYQLCPFHLERRLTQTLSANRKRQTEVRSLLSKGQLGKVLSQLEEERKDNPKKSKELTDLASYLISNWEGINTVDRLQKAGLPVDTLGAIEGNIDKILAHRFKKRGMSWSPSGALNLAKVGEKIINHCWDSFWPQEEQELLISPVEPKKEAHLPKEDKYDREYSLPVLVGPHQDRAWVKELRELISIHF